MSLPRAPLEASAIPAGNTGQRRAYIAQFIGRLGKTYLQQAPEELRNSREKVIELLVERGVRQVGAAYFEYNVDINAWRNLFRRLKGDAPAWPWSNGPKIDDMSSGMSVVYNKWRIDHNLPVMPVMPVSKTETSSGKGKATEKTTKVTKPAATKTLTRNGESSKSQLKAVQSVSGSSKAQGSRGESSQSMALARVPHRLQGGAPMPQAAPKELNQGLKTLFEDLRAALPEEECLAPPEVTPKAPSPVPPQVLPQVALPIEAKVTSPVPTQVLPQKAFPKEPEAAPLNAQERIQNPVVLNKAMREWFWERCSGGECIGVIAGPFSLNLPVWLDFERLVVGVDGCDIDAINNEILEPGVAISWEVYRGKPLCLVVGFKDGATSTLPQVQQHMFDVWCDVVTWLCSAVSGSPVSLAPYLRAIQVVSPCLERTPDLQQAQFVWQEALDEPDLFATRARKALECFDFWSPMIRDMIQQPLGIAEGSLAAWIWSDDDSDERTKRLNVAREVWLSSSTDPNVIRRATKWVHSFVANLQPSA